jgi:ribosomal protein L32
MAVPKKRVSRTRKLLRYSNWKKEIVSQALHALSQAKSSRRPNTNFRFAGSKPSIGEVGSDGLITDGTSSLSSSATEAESQIPPSSN